MFLHYPKIFCLHGLTWLEVGVLQVSSSRGTQEGTGGGPRTQVGEGRHNAASAHEPHPQRRDHIISNGKYSDEKAVAHSYHQPRGGKCRGLLAGSASPQPKKPQPLGW